VEREYATKEEEILERHKAEIAALGSRGNGGDEGGGGKEEVEAEACGDRSNQEEANDMAEDPGEAKRRKAQEKARRKREKAREKERRREEEIAEELAHAGPSKRELEIVAMTEVYLDPRGLTIQEVEADGNCLYRGVAEQCLDLEGYVAARSVCAEALAEGEEEYAPFAETHGHGSYEAYVEKVRNSSEWGGHLELRALSHKLRRTVVVYSAEAVPLRIGEEFTDNGEEIRLSFHRHYYALGEHYNVVVSK